MAAPPPDAFSSPGSALPPVRFGVFELDLRARELRKRGVRIRLADQPFEVLALLLERRGEVVMRQELQQRLWSTDTFVDFELSLNSAVRKLREALGDSAEQPRYIETLPRRGYRFIAPIEIGLPGSPSNSTEGTADARGAFTRKRMVAWGLASVMVATTAILTFNGSDTLGEPTSSPPAARVDPEAYALFLKGVDASGRLTYDGNLAAASYFEQAIARQPDFARAYERLANARLQHIYTGPLTPRDVLPQVEDAALRALALDDTLVEAHRILAIASRVSGDHARADAETRRAVDLAPTGESLALQAASLMRAGQFDEAVAVAEQARKLDPLSVNRRVLVATTSRAAGLYGRAIAELQNALQMEPGRPNLLFQLGATYVLQGDLTAAITTLEDAVARSANQRFKAYLAYAYALDGRVAKANGILEELLALRETQYVSSFGIALILDGLGDKAAALSALERASSERALEFTQLDLYPPFRTLVSEPDYSQLMRGEKTAN